MDAHDADGPLVFAGSASPRLTKEICGHLGVVVGQLAKNQCILCYLAG